MRLPIMPGRLDTQKVDLLDVQRPVLRRPDQIVLAACDLERDLAGDYPAASFSSPTAAWVISPAAVGVNGGRSRILGTVQAEYSLLA